MKRKFTPDIIITPKRATPVLAPSFKTPETLDFRDLVLKTEDQGSTPQCAAYTGTSWLESIMWRKTGQPTNYDPEKLYKAAKKIDGHPDEDGTTLPAVLYGMISLGWVGNSPLDIRTFSTVPELKRAIHRYGTVLLALNIGSSWTTHYDVLSMWNDEQPALGGHAVICCGFDRSGVYIQNSWGTDWGKYGFARLSWKVFEVEFLEGAYFKNILDGMEE